METTTQTESFEAALERFLVAATAHRKDCGIQHPVLSVDAGGKKYLRIVTDVIDSRSVFCFIEIATGNVLKAAGWKAPAKGVRGSIYSKDFPGYGITKYGAEYFR